MNIGIDIGGTTIGFIAIDEEYRTLYYDIIATPTSRSIGEVESCLLVKIKSLLDKLNLDKSSIETIGIGIPGVVSADGREIIDCPNLRWYNTRFGHSIFKALGVSPMLFNDASSACFGEYLLGELRNSVTGVMITLGTGLGGGIVLDGNIYSGRSGLASEFGHMTIGENYYDCGCGKNGCLETFVSASSIIVHANRLLESRGSDSRVSSAKEVFDMYGVGDSIAVETVDRFLKYLAIGINNIILTIDPDTLVIGGGVSLSGDVFIDKLRALVSDGRAFKAIDIPNIRISSMNERAGAIGSALLARNHPTSL